LACIPKFSVPFSQVRLRLLGKFIIPIIAEFHFLSKTYSRLEQLFGNTLFKYPEVPQGSSSDYPSTLQANGNYSASPRKKVAAVS